MKSLTIAALVLFTFGQIGFAGGTTNCEGISKSYPKGSAFCGRYQDDFGSANILCVPTSDGAFEIGGYYIQGNLTEEENHRKCLEAAVVWNSGGSFSYDKWLDAILPFPKNSEVQCVRSIEPNRHGVYETRLLASGRQLGVDDIHFDHCRASVNNRVGDYVCTQTSSYHMSAGEADIFQVVSVKDGAPLEGSRVDTIGVCVAGLKGSKLGRMCVKNSKENWKPWTLFDQAGRMISKHSLLDLCLDHRDR